jgi:hypothetical protein
MNQNAKTKLRVLKSTLPAGLVILGVFFLNAQVSLSAQTKEPELATRHSLGTSVFVLGNFLSDSPEFVQLDYGYRLTRTDALLLEAITWKYTSPLGIHKTSHSGERQSYPGYVKSYGVSVAYQCFLWKNLFTRVHATSFLQDYHMDSADKKLQQGYQLMLQFRLGYSQEFSWLGQRFYIEPNACCNYWPVNTNVWRPSRKLRTDIQTLFSSPASISALSSEEHL